MNSVRGHHIQTNDTDLCACEYGGVRALTVAVHPWVQVRTPQPDGRRQFRECETCDRLAECKRRQRARLSFAYEDCEFQLVPRADKGQKKARHAPQTVGELVTKIRAALVAGPLATTTLQKQVGGGNDTFYAALEQLEKDGVIERRAGAGKTLTCWLREVEPVP